MADIKGHIRISEAKDSLRNFLAVPQVITPMVLGSPGVGKSGIVEQLAKEQVHKYLAGDDNCKGCKDKSDTPADHVRGCGAWHDSRTCILCSKGDWDIDTKTGDLIRVQPPMHIKVIDIRLSTFDPIELKGLPCAAVGSDATEWKKPEWMPTDDDEYSYLFLDEFPNAPAAVQNAALQLVYDRRVHTHVLSKRCAIVCAGNTVEDGAFVTRLSGPLNNRLAHMTVVVNVEDFLNYGRKANLRPEILGAVDFDPDSLLPARFKKGEAAQPTPRTLEFLSRLMDQSGAKSDKEIRKLALPIIGNGATTNFMAFLGQFQRVKPEDIIMKGVMPDFDKSDVSQHHATCCAVAAFVARNADKIAGSQTAIDNMFKFTKLVNFELNVKFFRDIGLAERPKLVTSIVKKGGPEFRKIMDRLMKVIGD